MTAVERCLIIPLSQDHLNFIGCLITKLDKGRLTNKERVLCTEIIAMITSGQQQLKDVDVGVDVEREK